MYVDVKRAGQNDEVAFISGPIIMTKIVEAGLIVMIDVSEKWYENSFKQIFLNQKIADALAIRLVSGAYLSAFCRIWKRNAKGQQYDQYFGLKCDVFPREQPAEVPTDKPKEASGTVPFRSRKGQRPKQKLPEDIPQDIVKNRVLPAPDQNDDDAILRHLGANSSGA